MLGQYRVGGGVNRSGAKKRRSRKGNGSQTPHMWKKDLDQKGGEGCRGMCSRPKGRVCEVNEERGIGGKGSKQAKETYDRFVCKHQLISFDRSAPQKASKTKIGKGQHLEARVVVFAFSGFVCVNGLTDS